MLVAIALVTVAASLVAASAVAGLYPDAVKATRNGQPPYRRHARLRPWLARVRPSPTSG